MEALSCPSCHAPRDADDNFCRRCGRQIIVNLPVQAESRVPAEAAPGALPPALLGSVAVLALGTGLEWLARRLAGNAARAAGRALARQQPPMKSQPEPSDAAVTVREFFYVRRVELRR